jgi:CDGSH-type Zn-finger protein
MSEVNSNEIFIEVKKDKRYSICTCGLSAKMPYCDNAHRPHNEENGTDYKSLKIITDEDVTIRISSAGWIR